MLSLWKEELNSLIEIWNLFLKADWYTITSVMCKSFGPLIISLHFVSKQPGVLVISKLALSNNTTISEGLSQFFFNSILHHQGVSQRAVSWTLEETGQAIKSMMNPNEIFLVHYVQKRSRGRNNSECLHQSVNMVEAPSWFGAAFQPVVLRISSNLMEL